MKGTRVLVTRAKKQAGSLTTLLRAQGAQVIEIPAIEIRPPKSYAALDRALRNLSQYDWLILTSANAVEALFTRMKKLRIKPQALLQVSIVAIGPATKKSIEERGLKVSLVPKEYVAEAVVDAMGDQVRGKRILLARAKVGRDVIPNELRKRGARLDIAVAYETVVPQSSKEKFKQLMNSERRRPQAITFTSPSTVKNFLGLLGARKNPAKILDGIALASIGPVTSAAMRECGLEPTVEADKSTMEGLAAALAAKFKG